METHNANTFRDWYQMWLLANGVRFINCCRPQFVTFESNFVCCVSNINSICVHFAPINDKMNPMNNKYCVVAAVSLHLSLAYLPSSASVCCHSHNKMEKNWNCKDSNVCFFLILIITFELNFRFIFAGRTVFFRVGRVCRFQTNISYLIFEVFNRK